MSSELTPHGLSRASLNYEEDITRFRASLDSLYALHASYEGVQSTLATLPDKLSHDVLVPLGPKAFVPGRLLHPSEVTVRLGADHYARMTARAAAALAGRRKDAVAGQIEQHHAGLARAAAHLKQAREWFATGVAATASADAGASGGAGANGAAGIAVPMGLLPEQPAAFINNKRDNNASNNKSGASAAAADGSKPEVGTLAPKPSAGAGAAGGRAIATATEPESASSGVIVTSADGTKYALSVQGKNDDGDDIVEITEFLDDDDDGNHDDNDDDDSDDNEAVPIRRTSTASNATSSSRSNTSSSSSSSKIGAGAASGGAVSRVTLTPQGKNDDGDDIIEITEFLDDNNNYNNNDDDDENATVTDESPAPRVPDPHVPLGEHTARGPLDPVTGAPALTPLAAAAAAAAADPRASEMQRAFWDGFASQIEAGEEMRRRELELEREQELAEAEKHAASFVTAESAKEAAKPATATVTASAETATESTDATSLRDSRGRVVRPILSKSPANPATTATPTAPGEATAAYMPPRQRSYQYHQRARSAAKSAAAAAAASYAMAERTADTTCTHGRNVSFHASSDRGGLKRGIPTRYAPRL